MQPVVNRLKEPSSWAALAGVVAVLMPFIPPQYQWVAQALGVVFGGAGFAVPEKR